VVAPKKIIWRSISGAVDVTIWLLIFHSLDFRTLDTYLALGGMFVWCIISEIGIHFFVNDKAEKVISEDEYKKIRRLLKQIEKLNL
jgi:Na+/H+ antiporter NhaA